MTSVPLSLPKFDAQPQDNLLQVLNSLSVLESAIANVFGKISNRVQEERNKIQAFDCRIDNAKKKVIELSKTTIAVTVTSPATFPEPSTPVVSSSKLLFENVPLDKKKKVEEPKTLEVSTPSAGIVSFEARAPKAPSASSFVVFEKAFQTKRKMKASRRAPSIPQVSKLAVAPASITSKTEEQEYSNMGFDFYHPIFVPLEQSKNVSHLPLKGIALDVNYDWNPVSMDYSGVVPSFEELDGLDEPVPVIDHKEDKKEISVNNAVSSGNCVLFLDRNLEPQRVIPVNLNTPPVDTRPNSTAASQTRQQPVQPDATPIRQEVVSTSTLVKQEPSRVVQDVTQRIEPRTKAQLVETVEVQTQAIPIPLPLPVPYPVEPQEDRPSLGFLADIHNFNKNKLKTATKEKSTSARAVEARPQRGQVSLQDQLRNAFIRFRPAMRPEESDTEEPNTETEREWNSNNNNM